MILNLKFEVLKKKNKMSKAEKLAPIIGHKNQQ